MTLKSNNSNHLLLKQEKFLKRITPKLYLLKDCHCLIQSHPLLEIATTTSRFHKKRNPKCDISIKKWHTDLCVLPNGFSNFFVWVSTGFCRIGMLSGIMTMGHLSICKFSQMKHLLFEQLAKKK